MYLYSFAMSPTGSTQKVVRFISEQLAFTLNLNYDAALQHIALKPTLSYDTLPIFPELHTEHLVILGVPVYAGRVPNTLLGTLSMLKGNGARAIALVVYGNRHYDDALVELVNHLDTCGFDVIGAGAIVAEHAFSDLIALNRPDKKDFHAMKNFSTILSNTIIGQNNTLISEWMAMFHQRDYRPYLMPKDARGNQIPFKSILPTFTQACTHCLLCVDQCMISSIVFNHDLQILSTSKCIKCFACVKCCPNKAIEFFDEGFSYHVAELEIQCTVRREPLFFYKYMAY